MVGWAQGPQEEVLSCRDTLSLVLPAEESQAALTRLFLINRLWTEAARDLDCWREIKWEAISRGAVHSDAALPGLCLSVQRWWGGRLSTFDAGSGCPTFREMLTDDTLALIARSSPRLQSISFSLAWCGGGVCLQGVRAVVAACPQLQAFSISSDQQAVGLASVGDAFVAELAQRCPRITALELSDTSVGDAGLAAIAAAYGPQLSALSLNYTRRWSGRAMAELAAACPRLQVFSATAAAGLTDDALAALGASCRQLTLVRVDRCPGLTLDGVLRLVNRSTNHEGGGALRRVEMAGVWRQSTPEQQAFSSAGCRRRALMAGIPELLPPLASPLPSAAAQAAAAALIASLPPASPAAEAQASADTTAASPTCADDDVPPTKDYTCEQQKAWGKCEMCWLVSKGYCRSTCGLCGVDIATAPCSEDPQQGQDAGEPNPAPVDTAASPAADSSADAQAAPSDSVPSDGTAGTQSAGDVTALTASSPPAPSGATADAAAVATVDATAASSATATATAAAQATAGSGGSATAIASATAGAGNPVRGPDTNGALIPTDCQSSQLEAADAASTARARSVHCGKAAALATRGGTALASADGGSAVSQADGPAAAVTESKPGSATAVAVAGPGGQAAGNARA
ncbi:hypothetical protein ABPG75_005502 [Micractinium tetrahymenae]